MPCSCHVPDGLTRELVKGLVACSTRDHRDDRYTNAQRVCFRGEPIRKTCKVCSFDYHPLPRPCPVKWCKKVILRVVQQAILYLVAAEAPSHASWVRVGARGRHRHHHR